jgi:hypothetical protein
MALLGEPGRLPDHCRIPKGGRSIAVAEGTAKRCSRGNGKRVLVRLPVLNVLRWAALPSGVSIPFASLRVENDT